MNNINNAVKAKLLFILLLSNISIYMLASTPTEIENEISEETIEREGYSELKISGRLLTSFAENKPISILNKNRKLIIKYALLLRRINSINDEFATQEQVPSYIVYLPDTQINKIINAKDLLLLPYGKDYGIQKKKRRIYEINI